MPHTNIADHFIEKNEPQELDADMRPDDPIDILGRLTFKSSPRQTIDFATIKIDRGVRDYLVQAVRDRR
jgi:hypothetical protein